MDAWSLYRKHEDGRIYTDAEKSYILQELEKIGDSIRNTNCAECYFEGVLKLIAYKKKHGLRLREPYGTRGIMINGTFVNNANIHKRVDVIKKAKLENLLIWS